MPGIQRRLNTTSKQKSLESQLQIKHNYYYLYGYLFIIHAHLNI